MNNPVDKHRRIDISASPADPLAAIPDLGAPGDPRNRDVLALLRVVVQRQDELARGLLRPRDE